MAADPESSGDDSDTTLVLEYSDEGNSTDEGNGSSAEDVATVSASEEAVTSTIGTVPEMAFRTARHLSQRHPTLILPQASPLPSENGQESDISLDFGSDSDDAAVPVVLPVVNKLKYTSIAYYDTLCDAEQALHNFNTFVYTYHTRYLSPFVLGKVYRCRSHVGCHHRLKLSTHRVDATSFRYQLLQRGEHSGRAIQVPERGISPVMKPEIDALLKLGMSAGRVWNMMLFKYMRDPGMLVHVPKVRKMENRKAYLKKKAAGGWEINKFATLRNWTAHKMCQDHASYFSVEENNMADMNKLIVLEEFEHTVTDGDRDFASMGIVVTTRALFSNVRRAADDQGVELVLSTDGTYRIHFGGWVLVDCGGILVESTEAGFVQRFRPWLYMFVRTESTFAFEKMFRALIKYARIFFEVDVTVRSAGIDHADAIASALELVWPQVLTCWEHLLRQARKHAKLANDKDFIKEKVVPHLRWLHAARSHRQFRGLAKRVLQAWRDINESVLADWLQTTYLTQRWERWSVGSSSVPGLLPTQQPIESHHRVIKVVVTDFKKAPTISILNSVLPRVLLYDGTNLASGSQAHYAEGPLPINSVIKAKNFCLIPTIIVLSMPRQQTVPPVYFSTPTCQWFT